jgi:PAS domain S-box-containing protein
MATIIALYKVLPHALSLRTPKELEQQVQLRTDELNETIKKMRFMADAMPQMVWTAKPDGYRDYYNKRALDYTGRTLEELCGYKWKEFLHPQERVLILGKWKECFEQGRPFEENRILAADGNYYWHLTRAVPQHYEHGKVVCWIGTGTMIEQQKKAAEILEHTVLERTEELLLANEQLLQSNRDLEHFAAFASHDLQAPLRTIATYLGMLNERSGEVLDERSKNYINRALMASQRMRTLIDTLLQYSGMNASGITLEEVGLDAIVDTIRTGIEDTGDAPRAVITHAPLHKVYADEAMMTQLMQNLITNGIRYNNSEVPLINVMTREEQDQIIISVTDNGMGIPKEQLDKIFDVFTRLHSGVKGTGLGLSITKRIVEKHNGRIWVESEEGLGTTFHVSLPLRSR